MVWVAGLCRYPIKSHGREAIDQVTLAEGQTMPWDRYWAVTHAQTKFDDADPQWVRCTNFMIGVNTPGLAAIWAKLDEKTQHLSLSHQGLGTVQFDPAVSADVSRFLEWVRPLCPADRRQPTGLVHAKGRGLTDSMLPTVSIMNLGSHRAVAERLGGPLELERWRGNIWIDGLPAWAEFDWVGKDIRIGDAILRVHEPIERCLHTSASPITGERDADTLGTLQSGWNHQDFGVNAVVLKGGRVTKNHTVEVV